jgi:hypothetical protein
VARPPTQLGYRAAADDDRSTVGRSLTGAVALLMTIASWGWVGITRTGVFRSRLPVGVPPDTWFLAIPVSIVALYLGIRATREGQPAADSRLGNWALILTCVLWASIVAAAAKRS